MARTLLKYAKMPSSIVHPPGLFASWPSGARQNQKLDVTYEVGEFTYRFWGPEPLDSTDLRVLQGLVAQATADIYDAKRMALEGRLLKSELSIVVNAPADLDLAAKARRALAVRFHISSFVQSLGYAKGGSMRKRVLDSITRLSAVTAIVQKPGFEGSARLVTGYIRDTASGEFIVGLNPTLTTAVFSRNNFLAVSMEEVRQLKSDVALILHWRLHYINQGGGKKVSLATLCEYVYPSDGTPIPAGTIRRREHAIRRALKELERIGWTTYEEKEKVYRIVRPRHTSYPPRRRRGISRTM